MPPIVFENACLAPIMNYANTPQRTHTSLHGSMY